MRITISFMRKTIQVLELQWRNSKISIVTTYTVWTSNGKWHLKTKPLSTSGEFQELPLMIYMYFAYGYSRKINYIKGAPQNKTALLQLCSDSIIVLFHLHLMTIFPPELKELLEDSSIIKTGVKNTASLFFIYIPSIYRQISVAMRSDSTKTIP